MELRKIRSERKSSNIFPYDWKLLKVSDLTVEHRQGYYTKEEYLTNGQYYLIRGMDLKSPEVNWNNSPKIDATEEDYKLYKVELEDFLFVRSGNIGDYGIVNKEIPPSIFASYLIRFKFNNQLVLNQYFGSFYSSTYCMNQLSKITQGSSNININANNIKSLVIPLPPLPEQKAIAHILGLMDEAINKNNKVIAQKELRKKWQIQNLLTGKKRLEGFEKEKWRTKLLKDVLIPISRPVPKPSIPFLALGIRSHGKGTFLKYDFDPNKIEMDTLFVVRENDLIVNITFAWEGAIAIVKKEDDGALVSHRFPTFNFNPANGVVDYFRHFILQPRFKYLMGLISPGGAGRNRVLDKRDFLKLEVKVPSVSEQTAIAKVLQAADKEIQLLKTKTEKLKEQKKWLMQVLLTGKKRLKKSIIIKGE